MEYARKIGVIQNSLYGVDIQPIAAEISKLRCFLTLIVDENIDETKPNRGIEPLPNLEFKFVTADALVKLPEEKQQRSLFDNKQELEELQTIRLDYLQSYGEHKVELKEKFHRLQKQIFKEQLRNNAREDSKAYKISTWEPFGHEKVDWFDPLWMYGVKDFDVVISNPPYVQLSKEPNVAASYKFYLRDTYGTSGGRLNTFIFFIHRAFLLLADKGILTYIIPNTILTQDYYKYTREQILLNATLLNIVNYENMAFANAVVENVTLIIENEKKDDYDIEIHRDNLKRIELIKTKNKLDFLGQENFSFSFQSSDIVDEIFSRKLKRLDDYCYINQAIALKGDKSKSLKTTNESGKHFKLLDGRNIDKYSIHWNKVYLDFNLNRIHSCKRKDIFESNEKLMFRRVSENLIFTYDDKQYFALNTIVVLNKKENIKVKLKFLLCLLNSKLLNYLYKSKFKSTKKVFSEIQARSVGKLPIANSTDSAQKSFEIIADYIIQLKKLSEQNPINEFVPNGHIIQLFEEVIDALVYELYFKEDFKKAGIEFLKYAEKYFHSIEGLGKEEKTRTIHNAYQKLREKENEIRQNLKLMDTRLAHLIMPIKTAK